MALIARPVERVRRVLIVDDDVDMAELLGELLDGHGHQVRLAFAGAQALREVARFQPELALVDVELPDVSGAQLAERLRRHALRPLRVVAFSGWSREARKARGIAEAFDGHLFKPLDVSALEHVLGAPLRRCG